MDMLTFWREVFDRATKAAPSLLDVKSIAFIFVVWVVTWFVIRKPGVSYGLREYILQGLGALAIAAVACIVIFGAMVLFYYPAQLYSETTGEAKALKAENAQLKDAKDAVPVIHFNVNHEMILTLENRGPAGIEDVRLFQTVYTVALTPAAHITRFNKAGGPIQRHDAIVSGSSWSFDLKNSPFRFVQTDSDDYYLYRITFRHAIKKQKYVHYIVVNAIQGMPNPFQPDERVATAGVYHPPQEGLFSLQTVMREHNAFIFGDDKSLIYRN